MPVSVLLFGRFGIVSDFVLRISNLSSERFLQMDWNGSWIWTSEDTPKRNAFVRFRKVFHYAEGPATLHITADSRYVLYVNGAYLGQGPVRAWPNHWRYDTYDLEPHLRAGENVVAVLVNHYGESTFQYIHGPEGLLAQLEVGGRTIGTDHSWKASPDTAFINAVPRISCQEAYEEQYDGRGFDGWTALKHDDSDWPAASAVRPADDGFHGNYEPRGIPFLTLAPVLPTRMVSKESVRSVPYVYTISIKPYIAPTDLTSNMVTAHAYLVTQIWSPQDAEITFAMTRGPVKVNGEPLNGNEAKLRKGWNDVVVMARGSYHLPEFTECIDGPEGLKFCATGDKPGAAWAVAGPFDFAEDEWANIHQRERDKHPCHCHPLDESATFARADAFWADGKVQSIIGQPFFQELKPEHLFTNDVFAQAYTDRVVGGDVRIEGEDSFVSGGEWATVYPNADGSDVRILLDFGREMVGYHRFDIHAAAGTIVDLHNFEFIQPDGRYNFAEGMHNSSRYICRDGAQSYQTNQRRGFQYSYLILRNMTGPVKLGGVQVLESTYPQSNRGSFASSDAKLDRIWQVGANTLRCCAEDTYTDCPTYEQTHWVGDARNESLVDWAINGDPRLWYRCIEQTGDSLERSPITESEVPSGWQNILPAWTFLWMRSCREYLLFTGDADRAKKLLSFVERNVNGMKEYINADGLFDIRAWNMFDWAQMDTPNFGVVTHLSCLAVHGLNDCAEMADWLGRADLAKAWRAMAQSLSDAANKHLWNDEKQAYTDCLHGKEQSTVFSQQTQTAAYISGVATGDRAKRCLDIMYNPPEGFVKAGSPFFEFFLLEAFQREGREQEFVDTIRRDWGFMVDVGATSFWEMWSANELGFGKGERLTRSHCHGWSAAPTFFLSAYVLGVMPVKPGFAETVIEPHPGDLIWCRGTMPTPAGNIEVQWENYPGKPFALRVNAPEGLKLDVRLPRDGSATVNGKPV